MYGNACTYITASTVWLVYFMQSSNIDTIEMIFRRHFSECLDAWQAENLLQGHVTRCNFSCNLQRNSTVERRRLPNTRLHYILLMYSSHFKQSSLTNISFRGKLPCKLYEKIAPCDRAFSFSKFSSCPVWNHSAEWLRLK